jgi:DnaD/phage-associated family protein
MESGIDSHEKAEQEIQRLTRQQKNEHKITKAFGIHDRRLIPSEKAYIQTWLDEYGLGLPLIEYAYERTVEMKGKLSFAYINGILQNWREKGITTPAQAVRETRGDKRPAQAQKAGADSSYDMDELEKMVNYGSLLK